MLSLNLRGTVSLAFSGIGWHDDDETQANINLVKHWKNTASNNLNLIWHFGRHSPNSKWHINSRLISIVTLESWSNKYREFIKENHNFLFTQTTDELLKNKYPEYRASQILIIPNYKCYIILLVPKGKPGILAIRNIPSISRWTQR